MNAVSGAGIHRNLSFFIFLSHFKVLFTVCVTSAYQAQYIFSKSQTEWEKKQHGAICLVMGSDHAVHTIIWHSNSPQMWWSVVRRQQWSGGEDHRLEAAVGLMDEWQDHKVIFYRCYTLEAVALLRETDMKRNTDGKTA